MKFSLSILLLYIALQGSSQTITHHNNIWFHYVGKNMISKKTSFTLEATMRFANGFEQAQQFFIRPSIDYQVSKPLTLSVGYTYYNTYSYGAMPLNKTSIPEHHIWIQVNYKHNLGDFTITHRLRNENRLVGMPIAQGADYVMDYFEYRNRIRYMLMINHPILRKNNKTIVNGILADEAFFNVGSFSGAGVMNQNRVIAGLAYIINPHHQIQFAYVHQNVWNKANTIEEINPTLRMSYLTNLDFTKKKK